MVQKKEEAPIPFWCIRCGKLSTSPQDGFICENCNSKSCKEKEEEK